LFGNKFEKFYIHTGCGRNGKGVLFSLIENAFGNYVLNSSSEYLSGKIETGRPDATLAIARGKRFFIATEPSTDDNNKKTEIKFNVDLIKKLSGNDTIDARDLNQKGKDVISYKPHFTCFLQCNEIPNLGKLDAGIIDRLEIINYPFRFKENPDLERNEKQIDTTLKEKLEKIEYINAFIFILLDTYENHTGLKINKPNMIKQSNEEYIESNDIVKKWLFSNYVITNNIKERIKTSILLTDFNSKEHKTLTQSKFNNYLIIHNITFKMYSGTNYYVGIRKKTVEELDKDFDQEQKENEVINDLDV